MFGVQTRFLIWGGVAALILVLGMMLSVESGRANRLTRENADLRQTVESYGEALNQCQARATERAAADRRAAEASAALAAESVTADFNRGVQVGRAICTARGQ